MRHYLVVVAFTSRPRAAILSRRRVPVFTYGETVVPDTYQDVTVPSALTDVLIVQSRSRVNHATRTMDVTFRSAQRELLLDRAISAEAIRLAALNGLGNPGIASVGAPSPVLADGTLVSGAVSVPVLFEITVTTQGTS